MQRADALQPLSRQHKTGLMTCLLLRKGVQKHAPLQVMADFLQKSWTTDILPHFEQEERSLVPLLDKYPQGKGFASTILRDHELLRNAIVHIAQDNLDERLFNALADQLEQHIRYEERIVFQEMQGFVPAEELARLQFPEDQHPSVCNTYPNHFWE